MFVSLHLRARLFPLSLPLSPQPFPFPPCASLTPSPPASLPQAPSPTPSRPPGRGLPARQIPSVCLGSAASVCTLRARVIGPTLAVFPACITVSVQLMNTAAGMCRRHPSPLFFQVLSQWGDCLLWLKAGTRSFNISSDDHKLFVRSSEMKRRSRSECFLRLCGGKSRESHAPCQVRMLWKFSVCSRLNSFLLTKVLA